MADLIEMVRYGEALPNPYAHLIDDEDDAEEGAEAL